MANAIVVRSAKGDLEGVYIAGRLVDQGENVVETAKRRYGLTNLREVTVCSNWLKSIGGWLPDSYRMVILTNNEKAA